MFNNMNKWMKNIEEVLIKVGQNPENKYEEETKTFEEWESRLQNNENTLEDMMGKIEEWFES
ncbi:hypothetical protein ACLIA0_03590 [Bacillaceae bacterium W0354]